MARALRLTGAAVAAYVVGDLLSSNPRPVLAPLTALLVVQLTPYSTVTNGARRVVSVVAGVTIAVVVSSAVGFTAWSLAAVVATAIVLGQLLRLGPHLLEVPISAMLVLAVGAEGAAATGRVVETLVGAATGVLFNVLLAPPVGSSGAAAAVEGLAQDMAGLLEGFADDLAGGMSADRASQWLDDARRLSAHVARVDRALVYAGESRRLNPRAVGTLDTGADLRSGLDALEHSTIVIRSICRSVYDRARARPDEDQDAEGEVARSVRIAYASLLHDVATAIRAFGSLVRAEGESVPRASGSPADDQLAAVLDTLGEARARSAELLLVDPKEDTLLWSLHGAMLADVERVLAELDAQERARTRQQHRDAAGERPRTAQAVGRLRANTRQVTERSRRGLPKGGPNDRRR